jgi:hypothetical protein
MGRKSASGGFCVCCSQTKWLYLFCTFGGVGMYRLSVEHRHIKDSGLLADNITRHIRDYQVYGRMAVVAREPDVLLGEIKKSWHALKRETRREIDGATDASRKARLADELAYMAGCDFTSKPPIEESYERVQVATIEQLLEWAPGCQTMFVTYPVAPEQLHQATAWMPPYGLVIMYEIEEG